jgi:hypothetical protein
VALPYLPVSCRAVDHQLLLEYKAKMIVFQHALTEGFVESLADAHNGRCEVVAIDAAEYARRLEAINAQGTAT